jgi:hypothetical protein|tara:strand:- start:1528 stop:2178 length:651 start_codon:yes stop_codon:yes gene_type:complete
MHNFVDLPNALLEKFPSIAIIPQAQRDILGGIMIANRSGITTITFSVDPARVIELLQIYNVSIDEKLYHWAQRCAGLVMFDLDSLDTRFIRFYSDYETDIGVTQVPISPELRAFTPDIHGAGYVYDHHLSKFIEFKRYYGVTKDNGDVVYYQYKYDENRNYVGEFKENRDAISNANNFTDTLGVVAVFDETYRLASSRREDAGLDQSYLHVIRPTV